MPVLVFCKHTCIGPTQEPQYMSGNQISVVGQQRIVNGEPLAENRHDLDVAPICERQYWSSTNMPAPGWHSHHNICPLTKYQRRTNTGLSTASLQQKIAMIWTLDQYVNANIGPLQTCLHREDTGITIYIQQQHISSGPTQGCQWRAFSRKSPWFAHWTNILTPILVLCKHPCVVQSSGCLYKQAAIEPTWDPNIYQPTKNQQWTKKQLEMSPSLYKYIFILCGNTDMTVFSG